MREIVEIGDVEIVKIKIGKSWQDRSLNWEARSNRRIYGNWWMGVAEIVEKGDRIGLERWSSAKTVLVDIEENDEIELGLFFFQSDCVVFCKLNC